MARKLTKDIFIKRAKKIHNDKYDYSKVNYINNITKVCIICPIHGEFWQTPQHHLKGSGCSLCANNVKSNKEDFIKEAKKIHGDRYDYTKVVYINNKTKVCIICPKHGKFWQTPNNHLKGNDCPLCKKSHITTEIIVNFILENYDYLDVSETRFVNCRTKIKVRCKKCGKVHEVAWYSLKNRTFDCDCIRNKLSLLEIEVKRKLEENQIEFEMFKTFDWLKYNQSLSLDFYIPTKKIAIECQGRFHFEPYNINNEHDFIKQLERDKVKRELCETHGIKLLYYTNLNKFAKNYFGDISTTVDELSNKIID